MVTHMEWQSQSTLGSDQVLELQRSFLARVYRWMFLGLGATAFVAYVVASSPALAGPLLRSPGLQMVLWIGELALVWVLAGKAASFSGRTAGALFFLYAVLN